MTKYYCDRCKKEHSYRSEMTRVKLMEELTKRFDMELCDECYSRLLAIIGAWRDGIVS